MRPWLWPSLPFFPSETTGYELHLKLQNGKIIGNLNVIGHEKIFPLAEVEHSTLIKRRCYNAIMQIPFRSQTKGFGFKRCHGRFDSMCRLEMPHGSCSWRLSLYFCKICFTVMIHWRAPTVCFQMFPEEDKQDSCLTLKPAEPPQWRSLCLSSCPSHWFVWTFKCLCVRVSMTLHLHALVFCMNVCVVSANCVCAKKELIQSQLSARIRSFQQVSRGFYV